MAALTVSGSDASNTAQTFITATTGSVAAGAGAVFHVPEFMRATFFCEPVVGLESVTLNMQDPAGNWIPSTADNMNVNNNTMAIIAKGVYTFSKTATVGATGVYGFGIGYDRISK